MNITRENIDELNGIIRVSIEKSDYEANVAEVLKNYRKKASMPGFRPGKIPAGLVQKMYGKAALAEEVNKVLSNALTKYIFDEKLDILGEPLPHDELQKDIDWDKDTEFEFVFEIGMAPQIKLSFDKRSKYTQYEIEVAEEDIDKQVEAYASRFGSNAEADVCGDNNTLRGDFVQLNEDGSVAENGYTVEKAMISVEVIKDDAIKAQFNGKKVGDEVIFDIKKAYPNDTEIAYLLNIEKAEAEKVSGDFKYTIKEISTFVPAEINGELFKLVYGDDTDIVDVDGFRARIREEIAEGYKPSCDYKFSIDTREALVKKQKIEFPEEFLKRWLKARNSDLTDEMIENDFTMFLEDLKWQVIKENIVKEEGIKVDEEDVMNLARQMAAAQFRQYGMFNVPEEHLDGFAKQMLTKEDDRERYFRKAQEDKIFDAIKGKVSIEIKKVSKEEFEKMFEA